jgi:hypothetical protein
MVLKFCWVCCCGFGDVNVVYRVYVEMVFFFYSKLVIE